MTDADGTQDEELYGAFRSAIGPEPPMRSEPADDIARGRRRLRHQRIGTAAGVAVAVPVVALMTAVVPGNPSAGPDSAGFADDPGDETSLEAECVVESELTPPLRIRPDARTRLKTAEPDGAYGSDLQSSDGAGGLVAAGEGSCEVVPVEPVDVSELDRLESALTETLDPSGEHLLTTMAGAAGGPVPADGNGQAGEAPLSQGSVTAGWTDGAREGEVNLSVLDPSGDDGMSGEEGAARCEDPMMFGGPRLTCQRRELADGSTVLVGTGEQDGVERVTVRFTREDGQIVWATADEGSSIWREDGSGPEPLDALPVTVDQLIELVQDPRVHL